MPRYQRFTFLVNPDERHLITVLAEKMQRSQSDAVRVVVVEAARQLVELPPQSIQKKQAAQGNPNGH